MTLRTKGVTGRDLSEAGVERINYDLLQTHKYETISRYRLF